MLDTVRVTAASRLPNSALAPFRTIEVLSREQLDRTPALIVADYLVMQLGVDVRTRSAAQSDIAIRGSTFEQVLVLVDGVRMNDAQTGHFNMDIAVPIAAIDRIEIVRGPGSTLYGSDAVGGVINIVTRPRHTAGEARARGGSFSTIGLAAAGGARIADIGVDAAADWISSDGHRAGTDFRMTQGTVIATRRVGSGQLRLNAGLGDRDFGAANFYAPYPSHERTRTSILALRYATRETRRLSVATSASARRHSDIFTLVRDNPDFYRNRHVSNTYTGEASLSYAASSLVALAVGTEVRAFELNSARLGERSETHTAGFVEATLGSQKMLTINAGLRGDRSTLNGVFISPSIAASVPVYGRVVARASIARGFRAPTATERYYEDPGNVGDPNIESEEFVGSEVGLRLLPTRWLSADVAVFTRDAENLIDWAKPAGAPPTTPWRTMNIASAEYRGIEASLQLPEVAGVALRAHGSALRFKSRGTAAFTGKYALRPITRTLGTTAFFTTRTGVRASLDAVQFRRQGEDAYLLLTSRISYTFRRAALMVDGLNLSNASYFDASAIEASGRAVYAGISIRVK